MTLVRIIKNWDWPDLLRQTPKNEGVWDNIRFTVDAIEECDFVIMLNNNMTNRSIVRCPKDNIWALMQEPYVKGFTDWMTEGHETFARVYTHHIPCPNSKYVLSHPALPWHVNKSFDQLTQMDIPEKSNKLSWIVGNALSIPGHFKRLSFLRFLRNKSPLDIDLYGRAVHPIKDKWDGLAPYKYSLAIENSCSSDYWTEKIADCFLSWSIPFYYGCTNLEEYFPKDSFIRIDIENHEMAAEQIMSAIKNNEWEKRLPALKSAREKVLNSYQLFPHLAKEVKSCGTKDKDKLPTLIPPYKRSMNSRMKRTCLQIKMAMLKKQYKLYRVGKS